MSSSHSISLEEQPSASRASSVSSNSTSVNADANTSPAFDPVFEPLAGESPHKRASAISNPDNKSLNTQDLLLAVLNQPGGSMFNHMPPQTKDATKDSLLTKPLDPTEALLPKITPYSDNFKNTKSSASSSEPDVSRDSEAIETDTSLPSKANSSALNAEINSDKLPESSVATNISSEKKVLDKKRTETASLGSLPKPQGYRLPNKKIRFNEVPFFTDAKLETSFESSLITKPKKVSEHPHCRRIVAHEGFFVFPLKGGKIIVNKEVPGVKLIIKEHKECIVDLIIWEPSSSIDAGSEERHLVTIGMDSTLLVWNFKNIDTTTSPITYSIQFGVQGSPRNGSLYRFKHLAWNPVNIDIIAIATDTNEVLLLDLSTYMKAKDSSLSSEEEVSSLFNSVKANNAIASLAFSPDGKWLAVGEANGGILLVEVDDNSATSLKVMPTCSSNSVDFLQFVSRSDDSLLLIVGLNNQTEIQLWDMVTLSVLQTLHFLQSQNTVCYEKNSQTLFLGNGSRKSLLAFHLQTTSEPHFDFVSEFTSDKELTSVSASQDVLTSQKSLLKRHINLYTNQDETRMIHFTPITTYIPDFSSYSFIPDSYIEAVREDVVSRPSSSSKSNQSMTATKEPINNPMSSEPSKKNMVSPPKSLKDNNISEPNHTASSEMNSSKDNQTHPATENFPNLNGISRSPKKEDKSVKESPRSVPNSRSNKKSTSTVLSPSASSSNSAHQNLTPESPALKTAKPSSTNQLSPQAIQQLSDEISQTIKKSISANSQHTIRDINKVSAQLGTIGKDIKSLPSNFGQSVRSELSPILKEITSDVIAKTLHSQLSSSFSQFSNSKELKSLVSTQVQKHTQEVLGSAALIQSISKSVTEQLVKSNHEHFNRQIETVLIPAYQKSTSTMFKQLHESFSESLNKQKKIFEDIIATQQKQYDQLASLLASYVPPPTNSSQSQANNPTKESHDAKNQKPNQGPAQNSQTNSSAKKEAVISRNKTVPPSLTLEQELFEAIGSTNYRKIVEIFQESSPSAIFKYCEITQKNMLILAKLMTKEFTVDTSLKLTIIRECLNNLVPQDPTISDHVDRFVSTIRSNMKALANNTAKNEEHNALVPQLMSLVSSCTKLLESKQSR